MEAVKTDVFICNLPCNVTEEEILSMLKEFKPLSVKKCLRDKKCFAFVNMCSHVAVSKAIDKINGSIFRGRLLIARPNVINENRSTDSSRRTVTQDKELKPVAEVNESDGENGTKVYIGNIPKGVTEVEFQNLLKEFDPVSIRYHKRDVKGFAFVQLSSLQAVQAIIAKISGLTLKGCILSCERCNPRSPRKANESLENLMDLPELEEIPLSELSGKGDISKAVKETEICINNLPGDVTEELEYLQSENSNCSRKQLKGISCNVPVTKKTIYAIPMQMRGDFLTSMLKDCYNDLNWLAAIMNITGDSALLVTNIFPQLPYFWAVFLTQDKYLAMTNLFHRLAEIEAHQPYLLNNEVKRGTRCLAQCVLIDEEEGTWNRCWVVDMVSDFAIVFFMDYGMTANVPISSLRQLNSDTFWLTPPLAQPFMLQEGCCSINLVRSIIKGKTNGFCSNERHILMFSKDED